jgi:hypothetical protein
MPIGNLMNSSNSNSGFEAVNSSTWNPALLLRIAELADNNLNLPRS